MENNHSDDLERPVVRVVKKDNIELEKYYKVDLKERDDLSIVSVLHNL